MAAGQNFRSVVMNQNAQVVNQAPESVRSSIIADRNDNFIQASFKKDVERAREILTVQNSTEQLQYSY